MDLFRKRKKTGRIGFFLPALYSGLICIFLLICILLLLNSNLPDPPTGGGGGGGGGVKPNRSIPDPRKRLEEETYIGRLGETMVGMLPDDLPFTIFIPCSESFESVLNFIEEPKSKSKLSNDTFAILSRLMGFSTVPQHLQSEDLLAEKETITLDSVSGFKLRTKKLLLPDSGVTTLVVNSIKSKHVDIRMPNTDTIVHVMDGVIMDPQFALSF